mmetsp:Transcript_146036/g.406860  ORF Transcript_146036/g.406860 Transcript_146036/m.406860 type:complete len:248 (+) Transcript_146036:440-1183(+)
MLARSDLDYVSMLPGAKADRTLRRVELALLIPKDVLVVRTCLELVDGVRRRTVILHGRLASGLNEELVVPIGKEHAEYTDHATVDCIQLEVLVELWIPLFTMGRLHEVEPKEHRADNEDVQRTVSDNQVHAVRAAETMRPGLDESHSSCNTRHEQRHPRNGKPEEVHEQHLCVVCQLVVVVLNVTARHVVVILYCWQHCEQVVPHPRDGDTQHDCCKGLELRRVSHLGSPRTTCAEQAQEPVASVGK